MAGLTAAWKVCSRAVQLGGEKVEQRARLWVAA